MRRALARQGLDDVVLWRILRTLLTSHLPIRALDKILESLVALGTAPLDKCLEAARRAAVQDACHHWLDPFREIRCLTLEEDFTRAICAARRSEAEGTVLEVSSSRRLKWENSLLAALTSTNQPGLQPILLVDREIREAVAELLQGTGQCVVCLSFCERHPAFRFRESARVKLPLETERA